MGKRKQPISGWFSMVFRYPLFPSISHVCHIWVWWMGCLWANGFRSQRQFQSRSVHLIESQQCIRYRCEEQRDQNDTNWGGRPSHQSIKAHPEHRIPTAISYGHVQHHVKTCYNVKYTFGNEMWPAIVTAWWFKCELQRDDNQGQQAPRFDISRGLYKENHQQLCILKNLRAQCQQSRSCLAGVDLSLWAYGSQLQQCCRACCRHVVQWLHTFYSQLFLKTWILHHDICKPWQQICLYPWHEMTSGERIVVKSGKSMSIAVSMRISVELRAAMARERILKQGRPGKK